MSISSSKSAIILAIGFILGSTILGIFWKQARSNERYVTVKGLSEREVVADRAWMAISTSFGSNSVDDIRSLLKSQENTIKDYLRLKGFENDQMQVDNINIYQGNYNAGGSRYNANLRVTVSSNDVDMINDAARNKTDLIEKGVLISGDQWSNGPKFYFTKFKDLKTEMIAEATKEAERAAQEFAKNSGASVGKIRRANQGVFQILPSDRSTESAEFFREKIIRVVSTFDFFLD